MKILLINPGPNKPIFSSSAVFLPLGLAYIAAVCQKASHQVKILDQTVKNYSDREFKNLIKKQRAQIIGFTATTPAIKKVYHLTQLIKKISPAKIIAGGPHVTALPEEALSEGIDLVVRGEGEETILDLLSNLERPDKVLGLSYKLKNKFFHNPDRPLIKNLDDLPRPARQLFPSLSYYKGQPVLGNKLPLGTILTSRGCPFDCLFCYKAIFGRRYRFRSVSNILAEWEELIKKYQAKEMAIVDDSFSANPFQVIHLCDELIKRKLVIPWSCPIGIRVDTITEELILRMKKAGCYRVALGIESGSERMLKIIGKKINLNQVREAVKICQKVGIQTMGFFVLGNPGETEKSLEETINLAQNLNLDFAQFTVATPFPGTRLYQMVKNKLLISNWDEYGAYEGRVYFETRQMSAQILRAKQKEAYRRFYLRPRYFWQALRRVQTYYFFPRLFKGFIQFVLEAKK
ncbi:MAG: hypothetical protein COX39_02765 [Candidatus Nealsonbacteria bacterium CG23_combo_of_CG06-09_8_20_14_all_40_13]|uniref:Uncharacterized protein n=1 Tax=Candidatus Nealsonbacteria bacterium CG23_combo_of_CG06-09_8_20_14_all_40_13 TaxID=1974724 RepID=A0A2G9YQH2_9BACT|nr:MAG: hypothetical protein COX39_02765 [Candidatus Nealsonbacteria bacterium CG23_combo_of_CG06-09_8_20_14_all_40_13]PIR70765.1 MAG: hypothetical protein COU44_03535 [Candidatus Nealsonbacteria bacterium CG10_big_fil_rev_8_21_14_0_10_40_24]PIU43611.1 MAG: hypothetical protein COS97_00075 [Candidatus Nealsonbacteria bacterium CG07_land_8_20_14_0_80_40_10]